MNYDKRCIFGIKTPINWRPEGIRSRVTTKGARLLSKEKEMDNETVPEHDKENVMPRGTALSKSPVPSAPRTPLQERKINALDDGRLSASLSKVMKKARYSPITPLSTPTGISSRPNTLRRSQDELEHLQCKMTGNPQQGVPLNALVLKKAIQMVQESKKTIAKEYEELLLMKDQYIQDLELSLRAMGRDHNTVKLVPSTDKGINTELQTHSIETQTCLFHSMPSIGLPSLCTPLAQPSPNFASYPGGTVISSKLFDAVSVTLPDSPDAVLPTVCQNCLEKQNIEMKDCETSTVPAINVIDDSSTQTDSVRCREIFTQTESLGAFLPRLSSADVTDLGVDQLASSLKTSSISNDILRGELGCLKHEKESVEKEMQLIKQNLESVYAKFNEETQNRISDLMEREAELLTQTSKLTAEMDPLKRENARLHELNEKLQSDMCLSYNQHKVELQKLQQEIIDNDYKPLFLNSEKENIIIRGQLEEFNALQAMVIDWDKNQEILDCKMRNRIEEVNTKALSLDAKEKEMENMTSDWMETHKSLEDQLSQRHNDVRELEEQLQATRSAASDTNDFLNEEKQILQQEIDENKTTLTKLKKDRELLIQKVHQSKESYSALSHEFEETKKHAHDLLIRQGTEISESLASFSQLSASLDTIQFQLQNQADVWKQKAAAKVLDRPRVSPDGPVQATPSVTFLNVTEFDTPQSLVSSVITSLEQMPKENTPQCLATRLFPAEGDSLCVTPQRATNPELQLSPALRDSPQEDTESKQNDDLTLSEHVVRASDTVENIVGLLMDVRTHVTSFMRSLEEEIAKTQEKNERERQMHLAEIARCKGESSSLSERIDEVECKERRLISDLDGARQERNSLSEEVDVLRETIELRNTKLVDSAQNEKTLMKLQEDLAVKSALLIQREKELDDLVRQNAVLQLTSNSKDDMSLGESSLVKEQERLTHEVRKLQTEILIYQEKGDIMKEKANQRMKTLNSNWKSAEEELKKLDDFVERIGEALRPHVPVLESLQLKALLKELGLHSRDAK